MWHNELADQWSKNLYNVANGESLKSLEEFWSNPLTIKMFKDRIRCMIARLGYSPNIIVWEIMNEANLITCFFANRDAFVK